MILEILGGTWRYGDTGGNLEIQESGDTGSIWRYREVPGDSLGTWRYREVPRGKEGSGSTLRFTKVAEGAWTSLLIQKRIQRTEVGTVL